MGYAARQKNGRKNTQQPMTSEERSMFDETVKRTVARIRPTDLDGLPTKEENDLKRLVKMVDDAGRKSGQTAIMMGIEVKQTFLAGVGNVPTFVPVENVMSFSGSEIRSMTVDPRPYDLFNEAPVFGGVIMALVAELTSRVNMNGIVFMFFMWTAKEGFCLTLQKR